METPEQLKTRIAELEKGGWQFARFKKARAGHTQRLALLAAFRPHVHRNCFNPELTARGKVYTRITRIGEYKAKVLHSACGRRQKARLAAILATRRLAAWDGRPSPMVETAIAGAIARAERILGRIDARWPAWRAV